MLICDLHVHTNYSKDGESSIEDILKRAEEAGLDVIAITDHDSVDGAKKALTIPSAVLVIPGIEVSTRQGHLLVLGVTEVIPSMLDVVETITIARRMGALLILPHPYHVWRHGVARRKKSGMTAVDAVEAFNSRYIVGSANKKLPVLPRGSASPVSGAATHTMQSLSVLAGLLSMRTEMFPRFSMRSGPVKYPAVAGRHRCAPIRASPSKTHGER